MVSPMTRVAVVFLCMFVIYSDGARDGAPSRRNMHATIAIIATVSAVVIAIVLGTVLPLVLRNKKSQDLFFVSNPNLFFPMPDSKDDAWPENFLYFVHDGIFKTERDHINFVKHNSELSRFNQFSFMEVETETGTITLVFAAEYACLALVPDGDNTDVQSTRPTNHVIRNMEGIMDAIDAAESHSSVAMVLDRDMKWKPEHELRPRGKILLGATNVKLHNGERFAAIRINNGRFYLHVENQAREIIEETDEIDPLFDTLISPSEMKLLLQERPSRGTRTVQITDKHNEKLNVVILPDRNDVTIRKKTSSTLKAPTLVVFPVKSDREFYSIVSDMFFTAISQSQREQGELPCCTSDYVYLTDEATAGILEFSALYDGFVALEIIGDVSGMEMATSFVKDHPEFRFQQFTFYVEHDIGDESKTVIGMSPVVHLATTVGEAFTGVEANSGDGRATVLKTTPELVQRIRESVDGNLGRDGVYIMHRTTSAWTFWTDDLDNDEALAIIRPDSELKTAGVMMKVTYYENVDDVGNYMIINVFGKTIDQTNAQELRKYKIDSDTDRAVYSAEAFDLAFKGNAQHTLLSMTFVRNGAWMDGYATDDDGNVKLSLNESDDSVYTMIAVRVNDLNECGRIVSDLFYNGSASVQVDI